MGAALLLASLGAFLCSLDSALNVAFPAISAAFGVTPGRVALLIVFYHVPIGVLTVIGGLLGDRFGHRRVFACGVWTSALAFPLCGLAPDFTFLLVARAVQGVGAGLVFGTAPALVTLALAPARRAPGLGMLNVAAGAGLALAPLIAGVLVDTFGWRSVFLFRVPLALAAGVVSLLPLPAPRREAWAPVDVPTLSLRLALCNALAIAANAASFSTYIFVPYYLVDVVRYPASLAGIAFMAVPLSMSLGGLAGGWLTMRFAPRHLVVAGLALETVGLFAITTLDGTSSFLVIVAALGSSGLGLGLFHVPNMALVMAALPDKSQGLAGGMISAMRTVGILTTAAAAPWLFAFRQASHRPTVEGPAALFVAAFSDIFLASAALAACSLALALLLFTRAARRA
jgi:MFS family permease